jgi:Polyketide cyclase / dehydrase and lipid transport
MIEHDFRTKVARSPEEVFDFLVDLRNAPQWEPNCQEVEKTSDGPIGKGTTFRAKKGMGRLESEIVEFERPTRFASRDKGRGVSCGLDFRCEAASGGTNVSGRLWMEPHGVMRGVMVLFRPKMNRMLGELPDNLRRVIEAGAQGARPRVVHERRSE